MVVAVAQNNDQFTFADNDRNENGILTRGQKNWDRVRCSNAETCVSLNIIVFPPLVLFALLKMKSSWFSQTILCEITTTDWLSQQISCGATELLLVSVGY